MMIRCACAGGLALAVTLAPAWADVAPETLRSLAAPDRVETRIGTLEFKDGAPSAETAAAVYDTWPSRTG